MPTGATHTDQPTIAVLIPCYNESVTIGKVVDDFRAALPQATVYVYDNNSTDGTAQIARDHGAVVRAEPRQGKGNVLRQMLRDIDADCFIMVEGDDTYPAEAAWSLVEPVLSGDADMVIGDRISNGSYAKENDRALHGFGNNLVRWLIKKLYGHSFDDVMTGYRSFSRVFAKTLPILSGGFEIETELSIHAIDKGWKIVDVPVEYRDRPEGSVSKLSTVSDGWRVLKTIMSLFKDYRPMALFTWVALLFLLIGLVLGVPVVAEFYRTGIVERFPTFVTAVAFVGASMFSFFAGIILDTIVKGTRMDYEIQVKKAYERYSGALLDGGSAVRGSR
ncbi:MAG: glycosyltransferase [Eggerthellaceae bacterium]|nr:glycosyltransferase [Eggerthellaceae bacterium]